MFVVFDMDGTLSNPEHRVHFLTQKEKDWDSFYEACDKDKPHKDILDLFKVLHLDSDNRIEIWTGRREGTRIKTINWLTENGIQNKYALRMRKDKDYRHDTKVKGEWLEKFGTPDIIFEDRNSMVEFYRSKGIRCLQVEEGDF